MSCILFAFIFASCLLNTVRPQCLSPNDNAGPSASESAERMSLASMVYSTNQFKELMTERPGQNIFISPYSIWSALTLTYLGTNGKTGEELANVLGFSSSDKATVGRGFVEVNKGLQKLQNQSKSTLAVANKIIFDDDINIRECMVRNYYTDLARVNFTLNPRDSRQRINNWVQSQTENKVKNLIPEGGISALTKMVIVNAVYFKGEWYHTFDAANTVKDDFTLASGATRKVDMMKVKTQMFYGEEPKVGMNLVELPYSDGDFSMLILLPTGSNTVEDVIGRLTAENLQTAIGQMLETNVLLRMPKFKLEDGHDMVRALSKMGVNALFNNADLSGFTDAPISVSSVIHKAVIEVNEKGTEAAGATAVIMSRTSRILGDVTVNVDRPFIFLIRDNIQNVILFMGAINKPEGAPSRRGLRNF